MTVVIARDATAADHLVYAWPFPLGPEEIEITCGEDEIVVMCPSWLVGDRLGPGRHRWRTPDPTRPVGAYFVSTAPVETSFDVSTSFVIPATQQNATLRAQGSIIVRCVDPGLLIAQFVGLPFDNVNDGLLRSVTRSSERLIARVLTRRTVMAQTAVAVTDPGMLPSIIEELVAYNPAAGAVFGVEFVRMTGLYITTATADRGWTTNQLDISPDWTQSASGNVDAQGSAPRYIPTEPTKQGIGVSSDTKTDSGIVSGEIGASAKTAPTAPVVPRDGDPTSPGMVPVPVPAPAPAPLPLPLPPPPTAEATDKPADKLRSTMKSSAVPAPDKAPDKRPGSNPALSLSPPPIPRTSAHSVTQPPPPGEVSDPAIKAPPPAPMTPLPPITPVGSVDGRKNRATLPSVAPPPGASLSPSLAAITPRPRPASTPPAIPPIPSALKSEKDRSEPHRTLGTNPDKPGDGDGGGRVVARSGGPTPSDGVPLPVMGIGMGGIGLGLGIGRGAEPAGNASITSEDEKSVKGEIVEKLDKGSRVLVPGADGRLVSATIRQEQAGYYELEIGGSGETLWVPRANVVAEK